MIRTKIILDSISEYGKRLITYELTYPRFIHAEFMTHRVFSRNAASSRAIPIEKMIKKVEEDPAQVVWWGKNQSGMQAKEELGVFAIALCKENWDVHKNNTIKMVKELSDIGLHKQIANRLLEPFMNITVICTGTEWDNFFRLRAHKDAQPEFQKLAFSMLKDYYESTPSLVNHGEWHMPYLTIEEQELDLELKKKISVAKCARVSYLTHDGTRDYTKDLELYERLQSSGHFSPFEHVATPAATNAICYSNFKGWLQFREYINNDVGKIPSYDEVLEYFKPNN